MYDKSVDIDHSDIKFGLEYYKTQEICDKAIDTCPFVFDSVPNQYKTKEMCDKGALLGLRHFLETESHLKMMKNAFYFTLKAHLVLKVFKFLSLLLKVM